MKENKKIILIRHGATLSNTMHRFLGTTDEHLLEDSVRKIKATVYPQADIVFSSPMIRCVETAKLIYNDKPINICDNLRECNFGVFEGKNREDLKNNPDYLMWEKEKRFDAFPDGEIIKEFKNRCINEFKDIINNCKHDNIAIVTHEGVIMSILEKLSNIKKPFIEWKIDNAGVYECKYNGKNFMNVNKLKI